MTMYPGWSDCPYCDARAAQLKAAETLLEQADAMIEILLGDKKDTFAQEIRDSIERHWETYPDELSANAN